LLTKELLIPLLQSSYKSFKKETTEPVDSDEVSNLTDESYMVNSQLPAFLGRFYELENSQRDNTWAIIGG